MVGFFGFGGGVGVGFGFGNVGWVPLAPFELFRPWYGPGLRFGVGLNAGLIRNTNIAGVYRNARVGGVTAVSGADFQRGQFRNHIAVSGAQLQQASLVRGAVPITPTASNLRFSDRTASAAAPRSEIGNQRFFSRTGVGAPAAQRNARPAAPPAAASGWQRFGSPNQTYAGRPGPAPAGNGWNRFGSPSPSPQAQRFSSPAPSAGGRSVQVAPPIVQQRQSAPPSYNRGPAPSGQRSAPAPRNGGGGHAASGGHSGRR
jgi:hypothetical protein